MKKMIWILSVCIFALLLITGTVIALYTSVNAPSVQPQALTVGMGDDAQQVSWWDYTWHQPVCGGLIYKNFSPQPTQQMLPRISTNQRNVAISHSSGLGMQITIKNEAGVVFNGTGEEYINFSFPQNGDYSLEVIVGREKGDGKPYGQYLYKFQLTVKVDPTCQISKNTASQGEVVAVIVKDVDPGVRPTGESELGQVNFVQQNKRYIAFVPISYMRAAGDYEIKVSCGQDYSTILNLRVQQNDYPDEYHYTQSYMDELVNSDTASGSQSEISDADSSESLQSSSAQSSSLQNSSSSQADSSSQTNNLTQNNSRAAQQYRDTIWPLFDIWDDGISWEEPFMQPVESPVTGQFGAYIHIDNSQESTQNSGIYFATDKGTEVVAPNAGRVLYAGYLDLCGNTVVIEHGAGLKSFFYHLDTITTATGQQVARGTPIGTVGSTGTDLPPHLFFEMKIGNQSINPILIFKGSSAIYFKDEE